MDVSRIFVRAYVRMVATTGEMQKHRRADTRYAIRPCINWAAREPDASSMLAAGLGTEASRRNREIDVVYDLAASAPRVTIFQCGSAIGRETSSGTPLAVPSTDQLVRGLYYSRDWVKTTHQPQRSRGAPWRHYNGPLELADGEGHGFYVTQVGHREGKSRR